VRVTKVGGRLDLAQETLGTDGRGQFRPQHLDRHSAAMLDILGEVYRGHSACAELALDAVSVGERSRQAATSVVTAASRRSLRPRYPPWTEWPAFSPASSNNGAIEPAQHRAARPLPQTHVGGMSACMAFSAHHALLLTYRFEPCRRTADRPDLRHVSDSQPLLRGAPRDPPA
jgi:hypothetical protein